jgi:hypothetical protein
VVQHTLQTTIFLTTLYLLVVASEWPVVPMGTFLLHMIVLVMKMHSYLVTNAEFALAAAADVKGRKPAKTNTSVQVRYTQRPQSRMVCVTNLLCQWLL